MSPTSASSSELAEALAARLTTAAPPGVGFAVRGERLALLVDDVEDTRFAATDIVADRDDRAPEERLVVAVTATLSAVQDRVSEVTAGPWPTADLPPPGAEVVDGVLVLWFGDASAPALRLDPLPLAALGPGA